MPQNPAEKYLLLRQKNLLFFQKYFPGIHQYFSQYQMIHSKLDILPEQNEVDILRDGKHLYGSQASSYAKQEVASFLSVYDYGSKIRSFSPLPKDTYKNQRFFARSISEIYEKYYENERKFEGYELDEFFPLVTFMGIGLGKQIEILCHIRNIKHVIALETDMDNFSASLFAVDWQSIVEPFLLDPERSFQFVLVPEEQPEHQICAVLWNALLPYCPIFPITTLFYNHLGSPTYDRISNQINGDIHIQLFSFGNLDDELNQLNNALHNFKQEIPILNIENAKGIKCPICVVGSGPSLDKRIDDLKRIADHAVIISCGTALRALWNHGIKPDFQIELESDYNTYFVQSVTEDKDYMKSISLISAAQLNPLTIDLFGETRLFFKEDGALSDWFSPAHSIIENGTPTCTNAALAVAITLKAPAIYLFGLDYGFPDKEQHHASGSAYYQEEINKNYNVDTNELIEVDAAAGGKIYTTTFLYTAKRRTDNILLTANNSELFNCSDGAHLVNTKWLSLGEISKGESEFADQKHKLLTSLFSQHDKHLEAPSIENKKHQLKEEAWAFVEEIGALIKTNDCKTKEDFTKLCSLLIPRLRTLENLDKGMFYFLRGSIWHFLLGGYTHVFTLQKAETESYLNSWNVSILNMLNTFVNRFNEILNNTLPANKDPMVNKTLSAALISELTWEYQNWSIRDKTIYIDQAEVEYAGYDFDGNKYVPGKE